MRSRNSSNVDEDSLPAELDPFADPPGLTSVSNLQAGTWGTIWAKAGLIKYSVVDKQVGHFSPCFFVWISSSLSCARWRSCITLLGKGLKIPRIETRR